MKIDYGCPFSRYSIEYHLSTILNKKQSSDLGGSITKFLPNSLDHTVIRLIENLFLVILNYFGMYFPNVSYYIARQMYALSSLVISVSYISQDSITHQKWNTFVVDLALQTVRIQ